ncbi:MAG: HAD family phosphatase [Acidobacteriota bacterium]
MFRAVLFDFNGVLVDDEPLHFELFRRVLAEEGLDLSEEEYQAEYLGFDDRGCFTAVFERAGRAVEAAKLARLLARKSTYYQEWIRRNGYPFFAGAVDLVREAANSGAVLGVVSGALRDEVEGALMQEGLRDLCKFLVTADDVAASKPDPESYRTALTLLNSMPPLPERLIHPHEVLVIEDSPAGLASAHACGLTTVAVGHTYSREELPEATAYVESVAACGWEEMVRRAS